MKKFAYLIWIFAVVLFIGGIMGFIKAGSIASLVISTVIAVVLGWSGKLFWDEKSEARKTNLITLAIIFGLFAIRFLMTLKAVPLALVILTGAVLLVVIYLPSCCGSPTEK